MKKLNYLLIVVVFFSMSCVNSTDSARTWTEKDGVIRFSVISDSTTGKQWIARLESKGFRISDYAKSVLRSKSFKPTSGIIYEVTILRGELFSDNERTTRNIREEAKKRSLSTPNAEIVCLIREKFSDKELETMELYYIVTMHNSIKDSNGDPRLLDIDRLVSGSWLYSCYDGPGCGWGRGRGFAFISQVSGF